MITIEELKEKTGYDSFLQFKKHCIRSANAERSIGLTRYIYGKNKIVELDIKPEELFMAADNEIRERKKKSKSDLPKNLFKLKDK
ncbi:MAG TPA: hypothetical protein VK787_10385 [Puia sp.]|jgi:hypothetical protein|nr:hypothetical protein [Puia sp.]